MKLSSVFGFLAVAVSSVAAFADVSLSDVSIHSTAPGVATLTAEVTGTGDVFAEYAHDKSRSFRSVKDRYVTDGLIAMWDAVDNMGIGSHVPDATTWRDLAGNHADMIFTNAPPKISPTYYDLSAGGCGTPAEDIGTALNDGQVTVEVVCNVHSLVNDSTLFACVDGTDTSTGAAGNRLAWVRHTSAYAVSCCEYKETSYHSLCNVDPNYGTFKSYAFGFNRTDAPNGCVIITNGVWAKTVNSVQNRKGNAANAWFSLAQRICAAGSSAAISDLRIHCVRIYNRTLTNAEMAANLAVDRARFENQPSIDLDNPGQASVEKTFVGSTKKISGAKDYYAEDGLIAMWDGEDNQGTGAHVAGATTWKDLAGNHADMTFTATPSVGANYYDVSAGGCGISASDIATALNNGSATVEFVCDVRELVDDATLFACVDGTESAAGNRIAWARTCKLDNANAQGVVAVVDYKASSSLGPFPKFDTTLNAVRSYTFKFGSSACSIYRNGASTGKTSASRDVQGNSANAWFSLGQRVSMGGQSVPIMQGRIYCVRVYNRELTDEEIAANHAADVRRFYGEENELPFGSVKVVDQDGTVSFYAGGRGTFKLTGLRPDVANYTARLYTTNATPVITSSVTFESAAERPASAWYESLDSRTCELYNHNGPAIDLKYAANGSVPVVETRYQLLTSTGQHGVFGAIQGAVQDESPERGTYVIRLPQDGVQKLRYRLDESGGGYLALSAEELAGVQELVVNSPTGTVMKTISQTILDSTLAGQTDDGTLDWLLFGRRIKRTDGSVYSEFGRVRIWYFRLFSDGELVRDLVPVCGPDGKGCLFDRVSLGYYRNVGTRQFYHGPDMPVVSLGETVLLGRSLTTVLTRAGTAASDVYVAYGNKHGGATLSDWEHTEKLSVRFASGDTSLSVTLPASVSAARYVRFLSVADGWSDSAYIPDTKVQNGVTIIFR